MVSRVIERGDVVWTRFSPTEGHEQAGFRPALVVSVSEYMARMRLAVVIPLTTREKYQRPLSVELALVADKRSFALPGQVRTVSTSRIGALIARATDEQVEACLDAMLQLCGRKLVVRADNDA